MQSHPVWGAWIETLIAKVKYFTYFRRTPCGVRGLKPLLYPFYVAANSRTPCGVRGLKL